MAERGWEQDDEPDAKPSKKHIHDDNEEEWDVSDDWGDEEFVEDYHDEDSER
jgi:hypothetical protein